MSRMKFTAKRESMVQPLRILSGILSGQTSLPALRCVLLEVEDGQLVLTSSNLEIEISAKVDVCVRTPGVAVLQAKKLCGICGGFRRGTSISFALEDGRMCVLGGNSSYLLSTLPTSEFPRMSSWERKLRGRISREGLRAAIKATCFAMAHQDVRHYLNGLLLEADGGEVRAVAADGHRLAVSRGRPAGAVPPFSAILPRRGVRELLRMLEGEDEQVDLEIGRSNIRVVTAGYVFTSRLVDGDFPDYRQVLLGGARHVSIADRSALREALGRVAVLTSERSPAVRLHFTRRRLRVAVRNLEEELAEEILEIDYRGDGVVTSLNIQYVSDVLGALDCEEVKIMLNDQDSAVQMEGCGESSDVHVIMPVRV